MNLSSITEVASGIQTCLKEGLAFNSEYFLGKKTEALTAAASYQELAGFFMLAQALMGHLCIYQAGNMKE